MYLPLESIEQCLAFAQVQLSTLNVHENVRTEISFLHQVHQVCFRGSKENRYDPSPSILLLHSESS